VIDVQVTVASLAIADELTDTMTAIGFPRIEGISSDLAKPDARGTVAQFDHTETPALWQKRIHASADPGRPANVHLRVDGWPNQQFALLFTAWMKANPGVHKDYLAAKRVAPAGPRHTYMQEPWFLDAYRRAWDWADAVKWRP
jgi:dephospho-CoA kinase